MAGKACWLDCPVALTGPGMGLPDFLTHAGDSAAHTGNYVPVWRTLPSSESVKAGPLLLLLQRLRLI